MNSLFRQPNDPFKPVRQKEPFLPVLVVSALPLLLGVLQILLDGGLGSVTAAVAAKSMSQGWQQMLYGTVDPAGLVTAGPPFAQWPQAALVWLFGLSPWAVRLPQAIACALCCLAANVAVKKSLGEDGSFGGLAAAVAMACAPALAAMAGSADGIIWAVPLLLCAAMLAFTASDRGSGWLLALAMAVAAVAFNVLKLPALSLLPAIALLWFTNRSQRCRGWAFSLSMLLFFGFAIAWYASVEMAHGGSHPTISGGMGNSAFSLLLEKPTVGQPALMRFIGSDWGAVTVWLLPVSAAGGALALAFSLADGPEEEWRSARAQAFWLLWAASASAMLFFSLAPSPKYLLVLLPALAGLFAHSAAILLKAMKSRPSACLATAAVLFSSGVALTRWIGALALWGSWLYVFPLSVCGVGIVLAVMRFLPKAGLGAKRLVAVAGLLLLLVPAVVWSGTVLFWRQGNPVLEVMQTQPDKRDTRGRYTDQPKLLEYLTAHKGTEEFLCAAPDAAMGAALAADSGCKVLYYGGLTGEDQCISSDAIKALVKAGKIRYFVLPAEGTTLSELSGYVYSCPEVPSALWFGEADAPCRVFDLTQTVETD